MRNGRLLQTRQDTTPTVTVLSSIRCSSDNIAAFSEQMLSVSRQEVIRSGSYPLSTALRTRQKLPKQSSRQRLSTGRDLRSQDRTVHAVHITQTELSKQMRLSSISPSPLRIPFPLRSRQIPRVLRQKLRACRISSMRSRRAMTPALSFSDSSVQ